MSSSYESSRSRRGGIWSHWVPLAVTLTIATVGVATWAWSQRSKEEEEHEEHEVARAEIDYENADYSDNAPHGALSRDSRRALTKASGTGSGAEFAVADVHPEASGAAAGWGSHMSGPLRRTPSPQQFLSSAGKSATAAVGAATAAAAGPAMSSLREEDKVAYADHETWSEEAEAQKEKPLAKSPPRPLEPGQRRKTVVLVVSAGTDMDDFDGEHASILSHIPKNTDLSRIELFVLIYAPGIQESDVEAAAAAKSSNSAFNAAYSQALALVEKESMVMPFTTASGYTHMLRHLEPEIVYLQASLAGENGLLVTQLQSWLRHDVILIVGADGGHAGLVDSESETEHPEKKDLWWKKEERVRRGRGVVVVDSLRTGDDWARRVQGLE